jgi:hypothetical protein
MLTRENQLKFVRRDDFQLIESAVGGLLVLAPSTKLRSVAKTVSLHVVVSNLND